MTQASDRAFAPGRLSPAAPQGSSYWLPRDEYEGFQSSREKIPQLIHRTVDSESLRESPGTSGFAGPQPSSDVFERALLGFSIPTTNRRARHSSGTRELRATTGGQLAPTSFKVQSQDFQNTKGRQIAAES